MSLLNIKELEVSFSTNKGLVKAVSHVSLTLERGEILALVGESGSGKTVTCSSLMGLIPSPPGNIKATHAYFDDIDLLTCSTSLRRTLLGDRIAMIFQDPMSSLNPYLDIVYQLSEILFAHGKTTHRKGRQIAVKALQQVGIEIQKKSKLYPHQLSGGQRQRVMIAMALLAKPDLLIADEPTTALDVTVQANILDLIEEFSERDAGVILITHDMGVVARTAHRVAVMYAGRVVELASTEELFRNPSHPYTAALIRTVPAFQAVGEQLETIRGMPPNPLQLTDGCAFAPRCQHAEQICKEQLPNLTNISASQKSACLKVISGELSSGSRL